MPHHPHMGADPGASPHASWTRLVDSIHERNWQRLHHSPSLLLARRERMWRLLDRPPSGAGADGRDGALDD